MPYHELIKMCLHFRKQSTVLYCFRIKTTLVQTISRLKSWSSNVPTLQSAYLLDCVQISTLASGMCEISNIVAWASVSVFPVPNGP